MPEHRQQGLAKAAVLDTLERAKARGDVISSLYPAVLGPYRRLGFEVAGTFNIHRVPIDTLPVVSGDLPKVELLEIDRDVEGIMDCYREYVRINNGPVEPTRDDFWTKRILDPTSDETLASVVVRNGSGIEAFATFVRKPDPGTLRIAFGLECSAFVALTQRSVEALFDYFRGFRGLGRWVEWTGPPHDPHVLLVPEQNLLQSYRFHWMLRVLDVPGAFRERGWPEVEHEAIFAVVDEDFPENDGPWRLSVRNGEASVERASGVSPRPIPIRSLSALFSGFLRVGDAVRLGVLDADDPAVPAFARLLDGADPWCPFFF